LRGKEEKGGEKKRDFSNVTIPDDKRGEGQKEEGEEGEEREDYPCVAPAPSVRALEVLQAGGRRERGGRKGKKKKKKTHDTSVFARSYNHLILRGKKKRGKMGGGTGSRVWCLASSQVFAVGINCAIPPDKGKEKKEGKEEHRRSPGHVTIARAEHFVVLRPRGKEKGGEKGGGDAQFLLLSWYSLSSS